MECVIYVRNVKIGKGVTEFGAETKWPKNPPNFTADVALISMNLNPMQRIIEMRFCQLNLLVSKNNRFCIVAF